MSRCFSFPPPGYEKKSKIDETDLLAKEKHKEKRHKKDKKDKDNKEKKDKKEKNKKDKKDKKDKDRSKEKHKDKRDKREKNKDKDKNKERDSRDKESERSSDLKKVEAQQSSCNGEKLHPVNFVPADQKDLKHVQELAKRIKDVDGASRSHFAENAVTLNERKADLVRKINEPKGASGSQIMQKAVVADDRSIKLLGPDAELLANKRVEEFINHTKNGHQKENGQEIHAAVRGTEKPSVNMSSRVGQERNETFSKTLQNEDSAKQIGGNGKNDHKDRDAKGDKHKHKDRDRKKDKKSKDVEKAKKAEERFKSTMESSTELMKLKGPEPKSNESTKESLDFRNAKPSDPAMLKTSIADIDGNLGKRKEPERNGYLYDDESRPNKFARSLSCKEPASELKSRPEPTQSVSSSRIQFGLAKNHETATNDVKINGFLSPPQPNISPPKPSPAQAARNVNGEASVKVKPHPDMKYLSQILSVPKMDDIPDILDQEWLLPSDWKPRKKQNLGSPGGGEVKQVWSEAMQIDSLDISALPYVIPH